MLDIGIAKQQRVGKQGGDDGIKQFSIQTLLRFFLSSLSNYGKRCL